MSYSGDKGSKGERDFAKYLTDILSPFGYKFFRMGKQERSKKVFFGDVVVDPRTNKDNKCVLGNYFLESKVHARPSYPDIFEEAEGNANLYGKAGSIIRVVKQGKGHKRESEMIIMSPITFSKLIVELQGFRQNE